MGITAHWIDVCWRLHNIVLDVLHVTFHHTSENIPQLFLNSVHDDWDLAGRMFSITCNNATNNDGAISIITDRDTKLVTANHF